LNRSLIVLNDQKTLMDKYASLSLRYNVGSDEVALGGLAKAVAESLKQDGAPKVDNLKKASGIKVDSMREFAGKMTSAKKVCVVYNPAALSGNSVAIIKNLLSILNKNSEGECGAIPAAPATNALGAMDMGILPDFYPGGISLSDESKIKEVWGESAPTEKGFTTCEMFEKAASGDLKALVVFRSNPVVDFPGGDKIEEALKKVEFLVAHDMLHTETTALAHVVIPSVGPGFDEGTTTNIGGRVQYRRKGLKAESFPDWRILSKLLSGFEIEAKYLDSFTVTAELSKKVSGYEEIRRGSIQKEGKTRPAQASVNGKTPEVTSPASGDGFKLRVAEKLFAKDKILEPESALAHHFSEPKATLNSTDAEKLGIKSGDRVKVSAGGRDLSVEAEVEDSCNPGAVVVSNAGDEYRVLALIQDHDARVQVSKE
jgi:predicted molibdopterin-dependent oxidoreductase YjgC